MHRLVSGLTLASAALAAIALPNTASATVPGFGCTPILDGGLVAQICTSAMNGQVSGTLTTFRGHVTGENLVLSKCDAAGTTCTVLSDTATLSTPALPAKPGKYYRTCASFSITTTPTDIRYYSGCSPLVQAPTPA